MVNGERALKAYTQLGEDVRSGQSKAVFAHALAQANLLGLVAVVLVDEPLVTVFVLALVVRLSWTRVLAVW